MQYDFIVGFLNNDIKYLGKKFYAHSGHFDVSDIH